MTRPFSALSAINGAIIALAGFAWSATAPAEVLHVNASASPLPPVEGTLRMGSNRSPDGRVLEVNNQYLTIGGKPVIPVMGEFHFTRYPRAGWEAQLLKMKAAGITVVSTYVIWQHHEEKLGVFDWRDNRDLRAFVELCAKHGLYVYLRPGPWAHAEVRFGGLPDWLVDLTPTRSNDPVYLGYVDQWYRQISTQVQGLLWKEGGPVIGLQLENEYNRNGPGQGPDHIAKLKRLAVAAGLDVPLYSVTGWDNAVFPRGDVIPVFGSYVDEPWSVSKSPLPPKSSYAFQFGVRSEKGLGAQGATSIRDDGARDADITPFFGAEYGAGVPQMYRRRPVIAPNDISDMVITKIGSGVNLMGYYMFQGGQNPAGQPTRNETVATGGYNDVPIRNYDFQAPLGEYGQASPVLYALKPIHAFLDNFGDKLAPMAVYAPQIQASGAADLTTLRWSFRGNGKSGFVFVNNHVRQYKMAVHTDTRFAVSLASETVTFPDRGVTVGDGEAFIWPVHLDLSGIDLIWATAQPVTQISTPDGPLYVFAATDSIAPQFAFDKTAIRSVKGATKIERGGQVLVTPSGTHKQITITLRSGARRQLLVLSSEDSQRLTKVQLQGEARLLLSPNEVFGDEAGGIQFRQSEPVFRFGIFPAVARLKSSLPLKRGENDGIFQTWIAESVTQVRSVKYTPLRAAGRAPPLKTFGPKNTPVMPDAESFGASAAWTIDLPPRALDGVSDLMMDVTFQGDVARLFSGGELLDDTFYDGRVWHVGLRRYAAMLDHPLTLTIMPLRQDAQIYLDKTARPQFDNGQVARLDKISLVPEYSLVIQ